MTMKKMFLIFLSCCSFLNLKGQHLVNPQNNNQTRIVSTTVGFLWGVYGIHHISIEDDEHKEKFFSVNPSLSGNVGLYTRFTFHELIYSLDRDLLSFQNGMYWGKDNRLGTYLLISKEFSAPYLEVAVGFERFFIIESKDHLMHNKILPFAEVGFSSHEDFFVSIGVLISNQFILSK